MCPILTFKILIYISRSHLRGTVRQSTKVKILKIFGRLVASVLKRRTSSRSKPLLVFALFALVTESLVGLTYNFSK